MIMNDVDKNNNLETKLYALQMMKYKTHFI